MDAVEETEDVTAMFAAKKKKKSTKAVVEGAALAAGQAGGADPVLAPLVAPLAGLALGGGGGAGSAADSGAFSPKTPLVSEDGEREELYEDMLSRVYTLLHENNPDLIGREKRRLKPPAVSRVGTTRTAWTNFNEICLGMKRSPEHVLSFFLAELGTTGSIDGSDRLLVRGKYQPKYIESLLRKYISEYVICAMCRNLDTELSRDPITRLWFMNCKACGSSRSVAAIKAGFHATAKGERKKARALLSS